MKDCRSCANRIFNEDWGEYKCKVHQHAIYDMDKYIDCEHHKEKQGYSVVKIGDKVRFNPFQGITISGFGSSPKSFVTGKVVEVHADHNWFSVEYILGDGTQRTSFLFADIGDRVRVVK